MRFSSATSTSMQRCLYPTFQNQCYSLFFEEYLNPQARSTKRQRIMLLIITLVLLELT